MSGKYKTAVLLTPNYTYGRTVDVISAEGGECLFVFHDDSVRNMWHKCKASELLMSDRSYDFDYRQEIIK
jgi:hypothetical protein